LKGPEQLGDTYSYPDPSRVQALQAVVAIHSRDVFPNHKFVVPVNDW
jgi:hypothetical protein